MKKSLGELEIFRKKGKIDKYLDLAWEIKNLSNMKVKLILIVIGALGKDSKGVEKTLGN